MSAGRTVLRKSLEAAGLLPEPVLQRGPDQRLRLLHARFMEATTGLQDFNASPHDMGTDTPEDLAFDATNANWWGLMEEAINIRPTSLEGLRAKAEMAKWALIMVDGDSLTGLREYTEGHERLSFAVLCDLLAQWEVTT